MNGTQSTTAANAHAPVSQTVPAQAPQSGPPTPSSTFLGTLKEYKEFIAILIFIIGGAIWLYGWFATKTQLRQYNCLISTTIAITRADTDARFLRDKLVDVDLAIKELSAKEKMAPLDKAEAKLLSDLTVNQASMQNDLKAAESAFAKNNEVVISNSCIED